MKTEGCINEEVYDCLGFPQDTDYSDKEVDKPGTISLENRHRAKVLSNSLQRVLHKMKKTDSFMSVKHKMTTELVAYNGLHDRNSISIIKLFPIAAEDEDHDYANLPNAAFKNVTIPFLKAFIHVKLFETANIPTGQASKILKNKGKLEEAEAGVHNLLLVEFSSRELPVILSKSKIDDDGNIIFEDDGGDGEYGDCVCCIAVVDDDHEGIVDDDNEVRDEDPPRLIIDSFITTAVTPPWSTILHHPPS